MKLTILGCCGSLGAAKGPASGYLIEDGAAPALLVDCGPGVLAALDRVHNPADAHVLLSHMHADHVLDFPSLMIWRRYHPQLKADRIHRLIGPSHTVTWLGRLTVDSLAELDTFEDSFEVASFAADQPLQVEKLEVRGFPAVHPIETWAMRFTHTETGRVIAYSADSAPTDALVSCARDADVFLCEATWAGSAQNQPPDMHMSGAQAGEIAARAGVKQLVLVHIPEWADEQAALAGARSTFAGDIVLGEPGLHWEL
ncbi:MAG: MBL fold metallo-hydrolase [Corynebacterium sp.]|nr:MBL fold metallo-hydrolase [Corynebacterium sp.]